MRQKTNLACAWLVLLTLLIASQVQSRTDDHSGQAQESQSKNSKISVPQPLPAEDAFAALKTLEDSGTLILAMVGERFARMMGAKSSGPMAKENCFGWRVSDNKRVIGESPVGISLDFKFGSSEKQFQIIGLLDSEIDISIAGTMVKAGTYAIYANADEIVLNNKEMWSSMSELHLKLKQPLAPSFFADGTDAKARWYRLVLEQDSLSLLVGDNKLPLSFSNN